MEKKIITIGNWISYLFFLGVWLTAYIFYQVYELLALLLVLIALGIASIVTAHILRKKIQVSCGVRRKQAEKDQAFLIDFVIENPTILVSRNVTLIVEVENTFVGQIQKQYIIMPLRARGKKKISVECRGIYCGMMEFRVIQCEIRDWLGLILLKKQVNAKSELAIMPNMLSVQVDYEHMGRGEGEQETRTLPQKGDDVSEITQIREYVPGDRLQNIHWKLSAKSEVFLVKDYSTPVNHEITLLLDFRKAEASSKLDDVLELFFSAISFLCQAGQEMYVCWVRGDDMEEEHISTKEELLQLIFKIYEGKPAQGELSAYDYYSRLYSNEMGNTLYFCGKETLPRDGEYEQEIQIEAGEAVAVWL